MKMDELWYNYLMPHLSAQKQKNSKADLYLVILSSKTYVFEDKLTKYESV